MLICFLVAYDTTWNEPSHWVGGGSIPKLWRCELAVLRGVDLRTGRGPYSAG